MRFSPSTLGWYPLHIDYPNLPVDIVEVDDLVYRELVDKQIEAGPDGMPREYVPPPPGLVVPAQVTARQARLALLDAGKLDMVAAAIATLPSPEKEKAQIEWEFASDIVRASPIVAMLTPALGLDEDGMDALFIDAAGR